MLGLASPHLHGSLLPATTQKFPAGLLWSKCGAHLASSSSAQISVMGRVRESSCWVAMVRHPVRRLGERCIASVTCACAIPSVVGIVNTGASVIHGKYRSSEVNKSIVISIIDRNVYRWVTAKCWFSQHDQKQRPIRSVASDCLTKIYERSH